MRSATDFLSGTKIKEEITSPINGKIQVVKSLVLGTYIQVEGLTQSGGVIYDVWKSTLKKVKRQKSHVKNCLILGLGGGDAARLIKKYWPASPNRGEPEAKITGVEIDPIMVELGKKYLKLDETGVDVVIKDAEEFLLTINHQPSTIIFDLILVDLYIGYSIPEKFQNEEFIRIIKSFVSPEGMVIFNRLYYGDKKREAEIFHRKLINTFKKVRPIYPEANVMFVCNK